MSYRVGPHILYSRKATELSQFISELLDMDIRPGKAGVIWVSNAQLSFHIIQVVQQDTLIPYTTARDTILSFSMDTLQDLENLLKKVEFLRYRQEDNGANGSEQKPSMHQQEGNLFFFLKDLDGRSWKFFFQP